MHRNEDRSESNQAIKPDRVTDWLTRLVMINWSRWICLTLDREKKESRTGGRSRFDRRRRSKTVCLIVSSFDKWKKKKKRRGFPFQQFLCLHCSCRTLHESDRRMYIHHVCMYGGNHNNNKEAVHKQLGMTISREREKRRPCTTLLCTPEAVRAVPKYVQRKGSRSLLPFLPL